MTVPVGRVSVPVTPSDVAEVIAEGRERLTYEGGRARFRERLADRLATAVMERGAGRHGRVAGEP